MAGYSAWVRLADVNICFESDQERDICELKSFFKYHLTDFTDKADCVVVLKRQASFYMPKDAEMLWQTNRQGITEPAGRIGRRRVSASAKGNMYSVATCYYSRAREEYYYGLMHDKTWICYRPAQHRIDYVLHQRPQRRSGPDYLETADPLSAIQLLVHVITTFHGCFLIHGAAVGIDGKASLFLGRSGSGKSTLCTDLARKKAAFMGDDIVLVYMKDSIPMLGALLFPAKLHLDNASEKTEVDVPAALQTDYCLSAPLAAVYSVQQSGQPTSTVEARTSADLLQQLMEASNGMMMQYDRQQWLTTMYDICERMPYFLFHFGDRSTLNTSLLTLR